MRSLQKLVKRYRNLFSGGGEEVTDDGEGEFDSNEVSFAEHWGWFATIDELARGERGKWEYYLKMNIVEFFNEMAFRKDKRKAQSDELYKLIKGKTAEEAQILLLSYLINR